MARSDNLRSVNENSLADSAFELVQAKVALAGAHLLANSGDARVSPWGQDSMHWQPPEQNPLSFVRAVD